MPPPAPERIIPSDWEHFALWRRVKKAVCACPLHFRTSTNIEGLLATDIFTLHTALGATIEEAVVNTLNDMRAAWDPLDEYGAYSFVRQPQTFPDVVLRGNGNGNHILLGIELKGWYLLAKENAPTFRFAATQAACNPWDFLVVVPWVLSNVLAGSPVLLAPFVESARYCAQVRNYYWLNLRAGATAGEIIEPEGVAPYPATKQAIDDKPTADSGKNFGRLGRYGLMDDYVDGMRGRLVRGIPVSEWQAFFRKQGRASATAEK